MDFTTVAKTRLQHTNQLGSKVKGERSLLSGNIGQYVTFNYLYICNNSLKKERQYKRNAPIETIAAQKAMNAQQMRSRRNWFLKAGREARHVAI